MDDYVYKRTQFVTGIASQKKDSWKLWVPASLVPEVLRDAHNSPSSAHCGKIEEKI